MRRGAGTVPAPLLVLGSIVSVQFGGALAVTLLPLVGVSGSVALRLALATLLMWPWVRPSLRGRSRSDWVAVAAYGATLGAMNLAFYGSLRRLPIGVAVTIEFIGPLVLSAILSRHVRDFLAILLAAAGVVLVSGAVSTPLGDLDLVGILLALTAGACWAIYILTSRRTGRHFSGVEGLAIAMLLASVVVLPLGAFEAGSPLVGGEALLKGAGIAVLSSVVPYSLELVALRRLPPNVFGILLSLEPVVAAGAGLLVLGQRLSPVKLLGMLFVVAASVLILGAAQGNTEDQPAALDV
ncbi:EamA family transporter [Flexivirga oryzae]|uniref:Inner membrane transporter RhtA n=1 Tax=Flexivirga oryzae TaxID=1794944 RepID=A0A839N5U0_9MICO|nr:EamA family transporter [Flexivirga oryzae]MBB2891413.1 inner membrane transporter RhtA [Flexivirga oryzae]